MNLYTLHRLVITVAVLFCAGYAVRGLAIAASSSESAGAGASISALAAVGLAVGLALYLRWLVRTKGSLQRGAGAARRPPGP